MAPIDDPLIACLVRLDSQIKSGQRKKALRTADEALKLCPRDEDAIQAKLFLLIDSDKVQEALTLINQQKQPELRDKFTFQKAYCLYRLGQLQQAVEAAEQLGNDQKEAQLQLKAQLSYRLGNFDAAISLYKELYNQQKVTGLNVRANLVAAHTAGGRGADVKAIAAALKITPEDGFEVAFNLACSMLHCNQLAEAKDCLLFALRLGREACLDDDFTEEQAEQEMAPLNAQLAYISAASSQHHAALELLQEVMNTQPTDDGLRAIASNNLNAVKLALTTSEEQRQSLAEAIKQAESFLEKGLANIRLKPGVEDRLSGAQQQTLYTNRALLQLLAGRHQSAKDLTQQLAKRYHNAVGVQLLRASLLAKDSKYKEAEAVLATAGQPQDAPQEVSMMRAQMAAQSLNYSQAAQILESGSLEALHAKPALVATRVALLEASQEEAAALDLVKRVQDSQLGEKQNSKVMKATVRKGVLPIVARLQLKVGAVSEAFDTFKQLHSLDAATASSASVVGDLAAAALDHDPAAASSLEEYLPSLPEMLPEEVSTLEAAGTSRMSKGNAAARAAKAAGGDATPAKRKRKRKIRLPKDFDPENPGPPPDPERWLPKWQRADFKRKRRNRKDNKNKTSHQGGVVDESLDRTNTETPVSAPAPPNLPRRAKGRAKGSRR